MWLACWSSVLQGGRRRCSSVDVVGAPGRTSSVLQGGRHVSPLALMLLFLHATPVLHMSYARARARTRAGAEQEQERHEHAWSAGLWAAAALQGGRHVSALARSPRPRSCPLSAPVRSPARAGAGVWAGACPRALGGASLPHPPVHPSPCFSFRSRLSWASSRRFRKDRAFVPPELFSHDVF